MLVLSRKADQAIRIGDARIVVTEIDRGRVQLAIDAPPQLRIVREELLDRPPQDRAA